MVRREVQSRQAFIHEGEEAADLVARDRQFVRITREHGVGGADDGMAAPRHDEEVAALVAHRKRMLVGDAARYDVNALRAYQLVGVAAAIDEFEHTVGPWPRGIDGDLAADAGLAAANAVLHAQRMDGAGLPLECRHFRVVGDHRAMRRRIDKALEPQPLRRVHLAVIIDHGAVEGRISQRRFERPRFCCRKRAMPRHPLVGIIDPVPVIGEPVIERQPCSQHPTVSRLLQRHKKGHGIDHVGRNALPDPALAQRLPDEAQLE